METDADFASALAAAGDKPRCSTDAFDGSTEPTGDLPRDVVSAIKMCSNRYDRCSRMQ